MPSTSVMYAPLPLATNGGVPPTAPNARTGEWTAPGMERRARSNSSSDRVMPRFYGWRRSGAARRNEPELSQHPDGEHVAVGLVPGPFVVALVVALGRIERHEVGDLGGDRPVEPLLGPVPGRLGRHPLRRRVRQDDAPVLVADVRPLPVRLRRVVHGPEHLEQLVVAHLLGVERYLH